MYYNVYMKKQILLSGVKPTGRPHVGNYFGAMKQFVDLQDSGHEVYAMIADIHALNFIQDGKKMRDEITELCLDYLAIGLDPKKIVLFQQSEVKVHTELGWIFSSLTTFPYAQRAHTYKDAVEKGNMSDYSVGDFTYPMLMAADILLYSPDVVPVGKDQKQHIEFARDFAQKFNTTYGDTFKLPKEIISEEVGVVIGSDGRKMSKSYGNQLALFATEEETIKYIKGIAMDSKGIDEKKNPDDYALYEIAKLFVTNSQDKELRAMFEQGGVGYGDIKMHVAKIVNEYLRPMRERRKLLVKNPQKVKSILKQGGKRASKVANKKMEEVRRKVGLVL